MSLRIFTDGDDDWIETVRKQLYPKLHGPLRSLSDVIGVPLYAVGNVGSGQYVGYVIEDEDTIEDELDDRGRRNPFACLKSLPDGRVSEGSWVILNEDSPDLVEPKMQLHITLFDRDGPGREIYAHYEDDWRHRPLAHLRGKRFQVETGIDKAAEYVNEHTFLTLH